MHTLIPFQRDTSALRLPPPSIPNADANGGIGADDIRDPAKRIIVLVGPWQTMVEGDAVSIYWRDSQNDARHPVTTYTLDSSDKGVLKLGLPPNDLDLRDSGTASVWYTVKQRLTGEVTPSPSIEVLFDTNVPGGPDPDVTSSTINERLSPIQGVPPYLPMGQDVTLLVEPWVNMEVGDVLTIAWGSYLHRLPPLTAADLEKPITVRLSAEQIARGGDGRIAVTYEIRDQVNNWSLWAPRQFAEVELGSRLPRPQIIDADEYDTLSLDDLSGRAAQVRVAYVIPKPSRDTTELRIEPGDSVTLYWEGHTGEGAPLPVYENTRLAAGQSQFLRFDVPFDVVAQAAQGTAIAYYRVQPAGGGRHGQSARATVRIVGEARRLGAPTVLEASGGVLDPADTAQGATVRVPPYGFMQSGDLLKVTFDGTDARGNPVVDYQWRDITNSMIGKPVDFVIDASKIERLDRGSADIYYEVTTFERDHTGRMTATPRASLRSDTLTLTIRAASQLLQPPDIEQAEGDWLDPANVPDRTGATVHIERNQAIRGGDHVYLRWVGSKGDTYEDDLPIRDAAGASRITFQVPKIHVTRNLDGTIQASYRVRHPSGPESRSAIRTLNIGSHRVVLAPPRVPLIKHGHLDVSHVPHQGLEVYVDAYEGMRPGDVITLRWESAAGNHTLSLSVSEVGTQMLKVPRQVVLSARNHEASLHYDVNGWKPSSPKLTFRVSEREDDGYVIESYHDIRRGPITFISRPHLTMTSPGDWSVSDKSISHSKYVIFPAGDSTLGVTFASRFREIRFELWSGPDSDPSPRPFRALVKFFDDRDGLIGRREISGMGRSEEVAVVLVAEDGVTPIKRMELRRTLENGNGINLSAMRMYY